MYVAYFDGACEPNNPGGHMGCGWIIKNTETKEIIDKGHIYFSKRQFNTNNLAEYRALEKLLIQLDFYNIENAVIYGDSMMAIKQMKGEYRILKGVYKPVAFSCLELIEGKDYTFEWVPRDKNHEADALSKAALRSRNVRLGNHR